MSYIHAIGMKTLLKSLKNTFLIIFYQFGYFRPIPATIPHESDWQNQENHQKIAKNAIFQKSIFCYIVAGNMIFGRKCVLWTPESPQKAYIEHPTQFGHIF